MKFHLPKPNLQSSKLICSSICPILTLFIFSIIYFNLNKSLNFFDEGMYLYSICHPNWLLSQSTDFGNFFHHIFLNLNKDIYLFRVLTFFSLLLSSKICILSFIFLIKRHVKLKFWTWCTISLSLWSCIAGYYVLWLPTASYNTLALLGIFFIITSLNVYAMLCRPYTKGHFLAKETTRTSLRLLSLVTLALFGVIAFIGKPTTSAGMGVLSCIFISFTSGVRSLRSRIVDIIFAGLLAIAMLFVYIFVFSSGYDVFEKSFIYTELLDSSYSLSKTLTFYAHFFFPTSYVTVLLTWPLWIYVLWATHNKRYVFITLIIVAIILNWFITSYIWTQSYTTALMLWPLICILAVAAYLWRKSRQHFNLGLRLAIVFFVSGFIYHAGTNTSFEFKMTEGLVLFALALMSLCIGFKPLQREIIMPILAFMLCCAALASLFYPVFQPTRYKNIALWDMTEAVKISSAAHPIYVHPERKVFIDWLLKVTGENGWKSETPLLNTSYYAVTTLFLLDAYKVDPSWQIQARHTSKDLYMSIFSYTSQEKLHAAWIIKPHIDNHQNMPEQILRDVGLPFPEGYELLGVSPKTSIYGIWPQGQYEVWKPKP